MTSGRAARRGLRSDAARNREALIAAAAELVDEVGVANLTTDAVAARAELGKGTLFRRFDTRDALLAAVLHRIEAEWIDRLELPPGACPRDQLVTFGRRWASFLEDHRALAVAAGTAGLERHLHLSAPRRRVEHLLGRADAIGETCLPSLALLTSLELLLVHASGEWAPREDETLSRWEEMLALVLRCS